MPKISIIVPVYNVEKYLERCIQSLVNQTLSDIEIILVDDESPDNSPAICDEWAKKDNRIKVIHKKNGGLGFARNSGMEIASGEFVGFVDSDDYVDTQMYEKLYMAAKEHGAQFAMTGLCCVGGIMTTMDNDISYINCFEKEEVYNSKDEIDDLILNISGALPSEKEDSKYGFSSVKNIYSLAVIKESSLMFQSEKTVMSEDVLFVLEFLNHIDCAVGIPGGLYFYCRNEGSVSKSYRADRYEKLLLLFDEINIFLEARMPEKNYHIYTNRLLQAYARAACMQEIQFSKSNGITKRELKCRLKKICNSDKLQRVLKSYPWIKLPIKQAVFAFAMKYCATELQILLVRLREVQ